jgi:hypothetical protein
VNQLVRGSIYASALLLAVFLIIEVLEYFFFFPAAMRAVLFFGFIALSVLVLGRWVVVPMMHYFKLGKRISHDQAAEIIGNHFAEVRDRLLNILQLKKQSERAEDTSLIHASINQKITAIRPVPFSSAINLATNRRYLRYLVLPVLVFAFILFSSPNIFKDSTLRLIRHNEYFERKAPFRFIVTNQNLQAVQFEDFEIHIAMEGEALPNEAFIEINGFRYPLTKKSAAEYTYTVMKPSKDVEFFLSANGFRSKDYKLDVLAKPVILRFDASLKYPGYTGRTNETFQNIGDFNVPEGTEINWHFLSQHTTNLKVRFGDSSFAEVTSARDQFEFARRVKSDVPYTVFVSGAGLPDADSIAYSISVIPDRYPAINLSQLSDSTNKKYLYFAGDISDDYGIKNLYFKYRIDAASGGSGDDRTISVPLQFSPGRYSQFSHYWDLSTIALQPGDQLTYYFEVWDNDGVNGSKSTRSQVMIFNKPTESEMERQTDEQNEKMKDDLESAMKEAAQLRNEFEKMQQELLNKKNPTWEDKKKLEDLMKQQDELNRRIEEIKKSFKENLADQNEYKQFSEETREKAEQLEKLMDEVLTPEMKEMMQKLEELLEQLNKEKTLDQLQDQKLSNEQLQKELDRMLALFKQLEFEKKMSDTKDKLDQLAEEQNELAKKSAKNEKKDDRTMDSLSRAQEELQKEFDEIGKDLDQLDSLNQDLERPNDMPDLDQEQQQTDQEMQNAQQNLEKNNSKKASESQKNAAQKMQQMSKKMESAMQSMQMQQTEMDMQKTRQILENLVKISFDQEELINKTKGVNVYNPQYLDIMKSQKDVEDDLQMVKDSIQELSKSVFQIQTFVNSQIADIDKNMGLALQNLEQRRPANAASNQQYIMTAVNNLALIFDEVLQQLQQQMSNQMAGSQMCQKPGGQKQSMQSLRQMQQQLNDRIEQFGQQMKEGKVPKEGPGGSSEQIAKMAQEQAKIREALRQMSEQFNKDGQNSMGDLNKLQKEMEKTETDLLNLQITAEMKRRQQEILTRLLEAENAERQRETDNKRESNTATDMVKKLPPEIEEYLKKKQAETELFKTVPPDLKPFYRDLVEQYYKSLQQ